jgi:hypothetical protein
VEKGKPVFQPATCRMQPIIVDSPVQTLFDIYFAVKSKMHGHRHLTGLNIQIKTEIWYSIEKNNLKNIY